MTYPDSLISAVREHLLRVSPETFAALDGEIDDFLGMTSEEMAEALPDMPAEIQEDVRERMAMTGESAESAVRVIRRLMLMAELNALGEVVAEDPETGFVLREMNLPESPTAVPEAFEKA